MDITCSPAIHETAHQTDVDTPSMVSQDHCDDEDYENTSDANSQAQFHSEVSAGPTAAETARLDETDIFVPK
ncbi:hypothetical protein OS493_020120, partial [Desmophyllum pertusum]